jgi:hypothetical protein
MTEHIDGLDMPVTHSTQFDNLARDELDAIIFPQDAERDQAFIL